MSLEAIALRLVYWGLLALVFGVGLAKLNDWLKGNSKDCLIIPAIITSVLGITSIVCGGAIFFFLEICLITF